MTRPAPGAQCPGGSAPAAPPLMHQLIHHLHKLPDGAALLDDVARRRVEWHDAVADPPPPLALGVQPDDPLHPLADLADGPGLRIVVVVAGIAQHEDRALAVEGFQLGPTEAAECVAEIRPAMV